MSIVERVSGNPPNWRRWVAVLLLFVAGGFSLPLSATLVEALAAQAENWILVVHLTAMFIIGAATGAFVPRLSTHASRSTRALWWAAVALLAALASEAAWFLVVAD